MRRWFLLVCIAVIGLGFTRPDFFGDSKPPRELVAPPASIQYFTFGYREPVADMMWVRAIQDFDYCEEQISEQVCRGNGWLSKTLDLITDLSPLFRMAYSAGGMALTIIVSDYEGASKLFDKGVARLPKDWIIAYKAAYHALYEEKNQAKAGALMESAARNGAPDWVFSLANRLYTDAGKRELAERLIQELEAEEFDPAILKVMKQKLSQKASP